MEQKYLELIRVYFKQKVSLAGITSLLYIHGFTGIRYMELRKLVFKECQRTF